MTPRILGPDGRPIRRRDLDRPIATAQLTGVRQAWNVDDVAGGITPERLAALLGAADQGDARAYLTLAEQMEEREPHYRSVMGTRKRAVLRLPLNVVAASDNPADQALADEVGALARGRSIRALMGHLLDALGKGYAVTEIRWDTRRNPWAPRPGIDPHGRPLAAYAWIDPRWFCYDRDTGRELRLLDAADPTNGLRLPPYRFIVHQPALKSGLQIRAGLARVVAVAYMAKSYTLKDWLAFAEVYGLPLRLGKYGNEANEDDIQTLVTAVANIGTDAAAVVPESMSMEFVETSTSASGDLFERLADWTDRQVSKAVLGQSASSDGTAGKLGNENLQGDVRDDVRDADAEELEETLNRDLVAAYLALNHGQVDEPPEIQLRAAEPEDTQSLSSALAALVPLGLRVKAEEVRGKLGLAAPEGDDEVLGATPPPPDVPPTGAALNRRHAGHCPHCAHAHNREGDPPDALDDIEAEALGDWQQQMDPVVGPIRELAAQADDYNDFLAALGGVIEKMQPGALAKALAEATLKARGMGDATDKISD